MDVCLLCVSCVVKERCLRRADHTSRGVLPSVVCITECGRESSIMRPWPTADCFVMVKKKCWILTLIYVRYIRRKFSPNRISFDVLISNKNRPYKPANNPYRCSMRREERNRFFIAHFHSERPYFSRWSCNARTVYRADLQQCKYPGIHKGAYQPLRTVRPIYRTGVPLLSRCCNIYIYIFSANISTEYFKHAAHSPFFSSKYRLFHNATFLRPVLFTFYIQDVLKFKCETPVSKD
jgi:hypothetical protein